MNLWLFIPVTVVVAVNVARLIWSKSITVIVRSGFIIATIGLAAWILRTY